MDTVSIETKNGPVRINHSDYKPDEHKLTDPQPEWSALFGAKVQPPSPTNVETPPPAPTTPVPMPPATPPANVTPPAPPAPPATPPTTGDTPATPSQPPVTEPPVPPVPPTTPVPVVEMFVIKDGNKWKISDSAGKSIDGMNGPDGAGYDTKKAAEEAKTATK